MFVLNRDIDFNYFYNNPEVTTIKKKLPEMAKNQLSINSTSTFAHTFCVFKPEVTSENS